MHESSIMNNLMKQIESVAQEHDSLKVAGLQVKLGALSHFSEEHFREHFEIASKGGIAEGANLNVILDDDIYASSAQDILLEELELETN